jgi:acyl-coenzyme A thioesterase PaaI-like protein
LFYSGGMATSHDVQAKGELLRLVGALRRSIEASVSLDLSAPGLPALARDAQALADALTAASGDAHPFPRYGGALDAGDPGAMLPFSPVTGRYNPISPPVEVTITPGPPARVVGRVTLASPYEGPPASAHGAVVASIYDEILALAAIAGNAGGPTATLTVKYRRLTPLRTPLRFEAWLDRVDGRKAFVRGACYAGDDLVSEGEAMFVKFDAARTPWAREVV